MKTFVLCFVLLLVSGASWAQTSNHASIQKLETAYRLQETPTPGTFVIQQLHVTLKANADVAKIHLRVKQAQTGAVVYEATYTGSATQTDSSGQVLYARTGALIDLVNPTPVELTTYTYELSTENSTGQTTDLFTDNQ